MKILITYSALIAFVIALAVGTVFVLAESIRYGQPDECPVALNVPPCPNCGSKKFPPYGFTHNGVARVYRCKDCDRIWGPNSEQWLVENPNEKQQEALLPKSHGFLARPLNPPVKITSTTYPYTK